MIELGALKAFFSSKLGKLSAIAAVVLLCLLLAYCNGVKIGGSRVNEQIAVDSARVTTRDLGAKETAANERATDNAAVAEKTKDVTDVAKSLPDAVPSSRRVAVACARLRQQGTDTSAIPLCQRP